MSRSFLVKLLVILLGAVLIASCGGRRQRGNACRAPAVVPCAACSISCSVGQAAICAPGEADGGVCKTQASCVCR